MKFIVLLLLFSLNTYSQTFTLNYLIKLEKASYNSSELIDLLKSKDFIFVKKDSGCYKFAKDYTKAAYSYTGNSQASTWLTKFENNSFVIQHTLPKDSKSLENELKKLAVNPSTKINNDNYTNEYKYKNHIILFTYYEVDKTYFIEVFNANKL